jgi:hypothetical protein
VIGGVRRHVCSGFKKRLQSTSLNAKFASDGVSACVVGDLDSA